MIPNSRYWVNKGMGGGGGGGGGGGMFRTASWVSTRARVASERAAESNSSSPFCVSPTAEAANKQSSYLSASSPRLAGSAPVTPNSGFPWPDFGNSHGSPFRDEFDWVSVDGSEDERANDFVLGPAPSMDEVHTAVSALQQVVDYPKLVRDKYAYNGGKDMADPNLCTSTALIPRTSSVGSELDWMEPSMHLYTSGGLHPYGSNRVYDAFHLLQTDPCIQRMVISLSSDKAVWDAVLSNEAVRELRESYFTAGEGTRAEEDSDGPERAVNILKWILDGTKVKVMRVFETISKIVIDLFNPPPPSGGKVTTAGGGGATVLFEEKLRASFLLTVVVMVIVAVGRVNKA